MITWMNTRHILEPRRDREAAKAVHGVNRYRCWAADPDRGLLQPAPNMKPRKEEPTEPVLRSKNVRTSHDLR